MERFRVMVRRVFTGADQQLSRLYLGKLLGGARVMGDKVTITVKADGAVRLLASGEKTTEASGETPVLASAYEWLPYVDEFRTAVMEMQLAG